jgi:solute:Na+ symporter, SSS family
MILLADVPAAANISGSLSAWDLLVLGAAVATLFVITAIAGRRQGGAREYFLGNRRVPALVASLAFVATEVSAVTIVSVPANAFAGTWSYLQMFVGAAAARVAVAWLFVPVYYRQDCTSIYEYLRSRFGPATQYAGSAFFFVTRLAGSGLRLGAACLGLHVLLGWSMEATILAFSAVSIAFIAIGGIKAIMWNGAYSTLVFYAAGAAVAGCLVSMIDGGLGGALRAAGAAHKLDVFDFRWQFEKADTFWASFLCMLFLNMSVFGTDQDFVQRLLTVKTRRSSQLAMVGTIFASLPLVCLYLAIGTLIHVFYLQHGLAMPQGPQAERILSTVTATLLPSGMKGLVLAAIVLASIDSPLSSLSSSFVMDLYRPLIKRDATDKHCLAVSRVCVVAFGVVLALIAWPVQRMQNVLMTAFQVMTVPGGSILGVFLLGVLTRRRANRGNVVAMIVNAAAMLIVLRLILCNAVPLGWTWIMPMGTALTFALAWILGSKK